MRTALLFALCTLFASAGSARGAAPELAQTPPSAAAAPSGVRATTPSSASADAAATRMVKLRDGGLLWAVIEGHTPQGLQLLRVDTGGRIDLDWDAIEPVQAQALRVDYGYLDPNGDELLVPAQRLPLVDGRDVVGLIVNHAADALHVKTAQSLLQIPLSRISGPATEVQVPALDIYTKEELYQQKQVEVAPRVAAGGSAAAEGAFELARYCEKILDFAHAAQHYGEAAAFDPAFRPADIASARARSAQKATLQEQVDAIAAIDLERKRNNFDKGLALTTAFTQRWPASPLAPEWKKSVERLNKARDAFLAEQTATLWYRETERLARDAARKFSYAQCVEYAGSLLAQETLDAVTKALQKYAKGIEAGAVRAMWDARKKHGTHRASYGLGTWLLGEDGARKGLDKKKAESKPELAKARTPEQAKLEEALKRYLQNQEVARKSAGAGAANTEDAEAFWREQTVAARVYWMLAYHAENGGNMKVVALQGENCPTCVGTGAIEFIGGIPVSTPGGSRSGSSSSSNSNAGGSRLTPCPTCKHAGVIRRVVYY